MLPHVDVVHGFEITFNASDRSSWRKYSRALEAQLKRKCCPKGASDELVICHVFFKVCIYKSLSLYAILYCGNSA